jgi:hypothetical protein
MNNELLVKFLKADWYEVKDGYSYVLAYIEGDNVTEFAEMSKTLMWQTTLTDPRKEVENLVLKQLLKGN